VRSLSLERFNGLVEAIYRAGLDSGQWEPFLASFSSAMGGVWTAIHGHDRRSNVNLNAMWSHWDPDFIQTYRNEYAAINPWLHAARYADVGKAQPSEALVDRNELRKSRFYNEWLRPQEDISTGGGLTIYTGPATLIRISTNIRLADRERLQPDLIKVLDLLAPHFCRALRWRDTWVESVWMRKSRRFRALLMLSSCWTPADGRAVSTPGRRRCAPRATLSVTLSGDGSSSKT
jgi:hypothetical protein